MLVTGAARLIATGLKALNGFVLFTWSALLTYPMLRRNRHPGEDR